MTDVTMDDKRREIEELLPWYAAGVLTRAETEMVEAALAADPTLRRSLDLVKDDRDATILVNETLGAPSARAFEKLAAGMEAEPRSAPVLATASKGLIGWIENALAAFTPRRLAYAAAACVAVIAVQAAVIGGMAVGDRGASFQTASHGDAATQAGSFALVAFAPGATAADIQAFLGRFEARIVDGPRAGQFRVRIGTAVLAEADLQRILGEMRGQTNVVRAVLPAR